jgi:hypothetical protein
MSDLKKLYDAVIAAEAEVSRVLGEMKAALELDTEEGKQAALDLRPALDDAKVKADEANQLYISMRGADHEKSSIARKFVPVSSDLAEEKPRQMKRSEFEALDPSERMAFAKRGGKVVNDIDEENS